MEYLNTAATPYNTQVLKYYLSKSDVNFVNQSGKSALMYPFYNKNQAEDRLRLFIEHGADFNIVDKDGLDLLDHLLV